MLFFLPDATEYQPRDSPGRHACSGTFQLDATCNFTTIGYGLLQSQFQGYNNFITMKYHGFV